MIAALSKEPHSYLSSYHYRLKHRSVVTPGKALLRKKVGRYKAVSLMKELGIISKQPNKYKYKIEVV